MPDTSKGNRVHGDAVGPAQQSEPLGAGFAAAVDNQGAVTASPGSCLKIVPVPARLCPPVPRCSPQVLCRVAQAWAADSQMEKSSFDIPSKDRHWACNVLHTVWCLVRLARPYASWPGQKRLVGACRAPSAVCVQTQRQWPGGTEDGMAVVHWD